ncbi:hypothetical protein [Streptomyces filipinensis]|nr:hypothetical protein [Streptomyces filipinensis]
MVPVSSSVARLLPQLPAQQRDHAVASGVLRTAEVERRRNGTAPDTGINVLDLAAQSIEWLASAARHSARPRPHLPAARPDRQPTATPGSS